jgi:hypothetical protein
MKRSVLSAVLLLAAPVFAVDYETQQASSGPLKIEITCPTTDFTGVASSVVIVAVTIETFTSNDPTQLIWGAWENDGSHTFLDDLMRPCQKWAPGKAGSAEFARETANGAIPKGPWISSPGGPPDWPWDDEFGVSAVARPQV